MAISMEIDKVDNPTDNKSIAEDAKSNTVFCVYITIKNGFSHVF